MNKADFARRVHAAVGVAATATGLMRALQVAACWDDIRPFTWAGWHREHLVAAGLFVTAGIINLATARRSHARSSLAAAALLTVLSASEYFRHFSWFGAAFSFLAALDGVLLAGFARARVRAVGFGLVLATITAFGVGVVASLPSAPSPVLDSHAAVVAPSAAFEPFRRAIYVSSGVVPKQYLGFFDERGDTAAYETAMRRTVIQAVQLANAYAERTNLPVRTTEKEVAITFLAEGGALVLTSMPEALDRIHPVNGIGLDNYRSGFAAFAPLARDLDRELGTRLLSLDVHLGAFAVLIRPMTFQEAIAGTALMYLHQKTRTADLMARSGQPDLAALPLDRQFVTTSLVYNSGLLFAPERVDHPFSLGRFGFVVNLAAVVWSSALVVNAAWPRPEVYGDAWYLRFGPIMLTSCLLGAIAAVLSPWKARVRFSASVQGDEGLPSASVR